MAFSYQSLKKITGEGIIDGQLVADDFATGAVTTAKIGDNEVTSAKLAADSVTDTQLATNAVTQVKFASNAINLTGSKVTGTLGTNKGGTGLTSLGSANKALKVNDSGDGYTYGDTDLVSCRVFTSNGTWNRPTGVTRIHVQVVGGGGGGTGHGEAGGAGGYAEEVLNVTSISSVSINIGGGGGGNNYHRTAGNGGTTSFGPYLSAGGGEGARRVGGHSGGRPGTGSGGNVNMYGGGGAGHTNHGGGEGGMSYFGGSCIGVHDSGPQVSDQEGRAAYGSGGQGGPRALRRGGSARAGLVIVWEYK